MLQSNRPKPRRIGQICQRPLPPIASVPSQTSTAFLKIKDITVNNINLYNEAEALHEHRSSLYSQYQEIITKLQQWNQELSQRNYFLETDRARLIDQNLQLQRRLESLADINSVHAATVNQTTRNVRNVFEVVDVGHEEVVDVGHVEHIYYNESKRDVAILEQSDLEIENISMGHIRGHYYKDDAVDNNFSLESYSQENIRIGRHPNTPKVLPKQSQESSEQKTPCLNNHHSIIQCKSIYQQSPIRIFYLLLIQQPHNLQRLEQILHFQSQLDTPLLPLYKSDNKIWNNVLVDFFDKIRTHYFEDQTEIIYYINNNVLIDILLVECLRSLVPFVRKDNQDEEIGGSEESKLLFYSESSLNDMRDAERHQIIFRGLANHFQLEFEEDKERREYRFYKIGNQNVRVSNGDSDEMLLQSRTLLQQQPQLQISLHPQPHLRNQQIMKSRQQPTFKIRYDNTKKYFRASVCIRGNHRDDEFDYFSNCNQESEQQPQSEDRNQQYRYNLPYEDDEQNSMMSMDKSQHFRNPLQEIDQNRSRRYKKLDQQYLCPDPDPDLNFNSDSQFASGASSLHNEDF